MALLKTTAATGRAWMLIAWLFGLSTLDLLGQGAIAPEYQLKAVFLYNFAQFVDWPAQAFADAQAPLVIGILGDDPFGSYLDETVRGEKVNGHPLIVQRYRRVNEARASQVLFISRSESDRLEQIFSALKGRPVLTVGDMENFCGRGGMVRLRNERNKIRMRINLPMAKAANLAISSKLLRVAEIQP